MFRINVHKMIGNSKILGGFLFKKNLLADNLIKFNKFSFCDDKKSAGKAAKAGKPEKGGDNKLAKGEKNKAADGKAVQNNKNTKKNENLDEEDNTKQNLAQNGEPVYLDRSSEVLKTKVPLKNEMYEISHNYNKNKSPAKEKAKLENLVTQMLRNEEITSKRAMEIKTELRDPLNNAYGRHLTKIQSRADAQEYIQNFSDLYFYNSTFESFDRLMKYQRELRDETNPAYIQLRSQHKLVKNEDMKYLVPETTDVRQTVNSKDWLKAQPRVNKVEYSYNIEENKVFHKNFSKFVEEDKKKTMEKQKLLKYIKLNPDAQQVKLRFIPKHLPDGVTPQMIPDYDVDITGFKPSVTRRSRKKYKTPRVDTDFKNYEAWRSFDRVYHSFSEDYDFLRVELIPKHLINRFGPPGQPQHPDFTGMVYFEDENLDLFLVGDYMQTQETWGPNYEEDFYVEQEKTVKPEWRLKKWPSFNEFWESMEPKQFRVYYLRHSEVNKFKRWLKVYVNYFNPATDKSLDQILDEKFGKIDDYSDYNKDRKFETVPAVYNYSPKFFMDKDEKVIIDHDAFEAPKYISPTEGEMFDYEEYMKDEAKKGLKRDKIDTLGEEGLKF